MREKTDRAYICILVYIDRVGDGGGEQQTKRMGEDGVGRVREDTEKEQTAWNCSASSPKPSHATHTTR